MSTSLAAAILAATRSTNHNRTDTDTTGVCVVHPPAAGVAVMACSCGRMLDQDDMQWSVKLLACVVPRIVCADCRRNRAW